MSIATETASIRTSAREPSAGERKALSRSDFWRPVHCLLGLPFDAVSLSEAVKHIGDASASRSRFFLSTPNVNFLTSSQHDAAFRNSVLRSDLSVADGMPIIWIARLLGIPIRTRVAGSDLFEALMRGEGGALKVYFFGGPDGAAEAACNRVNRSGGPLRGVGYTSPGFGAVEQMSGPETIDQINSKGADFLIVSLSAKKGQLWIERNRGALNVPVISAFGAVVNFVAGTLARAPVWVRKMGLEWVWRIKEEPALWRRYLGDALVLLRLMVTRVLPSLAYRALGLPRSGSAPSQVVVTAASGVTRVTLSGAWPEADLPMLRQTFETVTGEPADIVLDMAGVTRADDAFIGVLMLLYGHQLKVSRAFRVDGVTPSLRRAFWLRCAEFML